MKGLQLLVPVMQSFAARLDDHKDNVQHSHCQSTDEVCNRQQQGQ